MLSSKAGLYIKTKQATNIMILIGSFIALIFSIFSASFLYFKLFTDLERDKKFYHSLSKIGLSQREMNLATSIQIALLFYIPFVMASIQTYLGLQIVSDIVYLNQNSLQSSLIAIGAFLVLQTIVIRMQYIHKLKQAMV